MLAFAMEYPVTTAIVVVLVLAQVHRTIRIIFRGYPPDEEV